MTVHAMFMLNEDMLSILVYWVSIITKAHGIQEQLIHGSAVLNIESRSV